MDKEEQKCLPLLLNCFYYRETLFIVYELLRDNLYHMYAHAPTAQHTHTSGPGPAVRVNKNNRLNSRLTPCACQLQVHRRVPAAKVLHGEPHSPHQPSEGPSSLSPHPPRRLDETHGRSPSTRLSACRRSLGNASARSSLCTRTGSSTATWCATLRSEALLWFGPFTCLVDRPLTLASCSPVCRNRRTS